MGEGSGYRSPMPLPTRARWPSPPLHAGPALLAGALLISACGADRLPSGLRISMRRLEPPSACTLAPAGSPEDRLDPGELRVLVLSQTGAAVPGARVELSLRPYAAEADPRGLATFSGLPAGPLTWTLDKEGFAPAWSGPATLPPQEGAFMTCVLEATTPALASGR